jgi:hypothetical protein
VVVNVNKISKKILYILYFLSTVRTTLELEPESHIDTFPAPEDDSCFGSDPSTL